MQPAKNHPFRKNHQKNTNQTPSPSHYKNGKRAIGIDEGTKYSNVLSFKEVYVTPKIRAFFDRVRQMLENPNINVLFIFGPSGCGKRAALEKFLNETQTPYRIRTEQFYQSNYNFEDLDSQHKQAEIKYLEEVITELLQSRSGLQSLYLFYDYPVTLSRKGGPFQGSYKKFQKEMFKFIHCTRAKVIFCLNSSVYNDYYVLNRSMEGFEFDSLNNVMVEKLKAYTNTEIGKIITQFIQHYPIYNTLSKEVLKEVIEASSGDARVALNQIYWSHAEIIARRNRRAQDGIPVRKLINFAKEPRDRSGQLQKIKHLNITQSSGNKRGIQWSMSGRKNKETSQNQVRERLTLFHLLGKYLYSKRRDPTNGKVDFFPENQILDKDLPFYFSPLELFQQSRVSLRIFHDMLHANYIQRFGKRADVAKMAGVLKDVDVMFPWHVMLKSGVEIEAGDDILAAALLTYGPLICNLNSNLVKREMFKIRRSALSTVDREIKERKKFIKSYYQNHRLKDLILFAAILRTNGKTGVHPITDILSRRGCFEPSFKDNIQNLNEEMQLQEELKGAHSSRDQVFKRIIMEKQEKIKRQKILMKLLAEDEEGSQDSDISMEEEWKGPAISNNQQSQKIHNYK